MSIQIQTNKHDSTGLKASKTLLLQKIKRNQVLEQGLPGTTLEGYLTERFWIKATSRSLDSSSGTAYCSQGSGGGTAYCLQDMRSSLNKSIT